MSVRTITCVSVLVAWMASPCGGQETKPPSNLSIRLVGTEDFPRLTVVMKNEGKTDLKVVGGGSWGWISLSFCVAGEEGGAGYLHRKLRAFSKNTPSPNTLKPAEELLRKVDLGDGTWVGPSGLPPEISQISAVFNTPPSPTASYFDLWVGTAVTPWYPIASAKKLDIETGAVVGDAGRRNVVLSGMFVVGAIAGGVIGFVCGAIVAKRSKPHVDRENGNPDKPKSASA